MSIYKDKERGCYVFEFSRRIGGERVRATKALPKTWTRAQADAYDRQESARLYATGSGVEKPERSIEEAVACYLIERAPKLKQGGNVERELALIYWVYQGRQMSELPAVCKEYALKAVNDKGQSLAPASIRNRICYLTAACRYAWKHHDYCEHDPGEKVVVPEVKNERHHYVDRATMLKLCRATHNKTARMAVRMAFYSGMRLSEILRAVPSGGVWVLFRVRLRSITIAREPHEIRIFACAWSALGAPNACSCPNFYQQLSAYFGHASRSPSTFAWQSAYIRTVSVAQASTSRPVTPVSRSRPGQLESKFAGIGIAGDVGVEDAQPI